jgi:light-regulated signal transduction histidine kinase (bacteriophytochrome)
VHVWAEPQPEGWQFAMRDQGIGLMPDYAESIFGVGKRLHSRGRYPGTGMGLAICKKIVNQHGGRIWVDSILGGGSTFYFTLPLSSPVQEA